MFQESAKGLNKFFYWNDKGIFSMIKVFDKNIKNASVVFKVKCETPDILLEKKIIINSSI